MEISSKTSALQRFIATTNSSYYTQKAFTTNSFQIAINIARIIMVIASSMDLCFKRIVLSSFIKPSYWACIIIATEAFDRAVDSNLLQNL